MTSSLISDDVIIKKPRNFYQKVGKGSRFICVKFQIFWVKTADSATNVVKKRAKKPPCFSKIQKSPPGIGLKHKLN